VSVTDAPLTIGERHLAVETLTLLGVSESAQTPMLARTHAPIGKGGKNWITKLKPGNQGQLPAYIQNIRNAIMRDGTPESQATAIAIGRCKDWAEGNGNVSAEVQRAAAAAIAEWERDKAKSKVKENAVSALDMEWPDELGADELGAHLVLEAGTDDGKKMPSVYCVRDKQKVKPTDDGKCPKCGLNLSSAIKAASKVQESALSAKERKALPASAFVFPDTQEYPIHDLSHARNALSRASGKPEEAKVKAAVYKKYPQLKPTS
jgi:hypothetical protein